MFNVIALYVVQCNLSATAVVQFGCIRNVSAASTLAGKFSHGGGGGGGVAIITGAPMVTARLSRSHSSGNPKLS